MMLMGDVEDPVGNGLRLREIVIARPRPSERWLQPNWPDGATALIQARRIDGCIDRDVADVNPVNQSSYAIRR
jgi:hypothetical protein